MTRETTKMEKETYFETLSKRARFDILVSLQKNHKIIRQYAKYKGRYEEIFSRYIQKCLALNLHENGYHALDQSKTTFIKGELVWNLSIGSCKESSIRSV